MKRSLPTLPKGAHPPCPPHQARCDEAAVRPEASHQESTCGEQSAQGNLRKIGTFAAEVSSGYTITKAGSRESGQQPAVTWTLAPTYFHLSVCLNIST